VPTSSERLEVRAYMYGDLAAELLFWADNSNSVMEAEEYEKASLKFRAESDRLQKLAKTRAKKETKLEHRRKLK
jgi:hypothetical protein